MLSVLNEEYERLRLRSAEPEAAMEDQNAPVRLEIVQALGRLLLRSWAFHVRPQRRVRCGHGCHCKRREQRHDFMSDDEDDIEPRCDWDAGADHSEPFGSRVCVECNGGTIGETCGFCGNDLCPACFDSGGGFCSARHRQSEIDAYEDAMFPPATPEAKQSRERHRNARRELQAAGILPTP